MDATQIASNWEKLGIVGLLILALGLLVWSMFKLIQYMLRKHEETTGALRAEIGRREQMLADHQKDMVKLVETVTAAQQRGSDVTREVTEAIREMTKTIARCRNGGERANE